MTADVELLDLADVEALAPSSDPWSDRSRRYAAALMRDGPRHYVENAYVAARLLRVDGALLPVMIADGASARRDGPLRPPTDVCSPRSHYASYTLEEFAKRRPEISGWLLSALFAPLRLAMWMGASDRIVYVNNWLLTTNPVFALSREQLVAVVGHLAERYPGSFVALRTVSGSLYPGLHAALAGAGFRMVRSRRVYALLPGHGSYVRQENVRRDLRLIERGGYEIVDDAECFDREAERLVDLYRGLYLDKHSRLNLQLNQHFVRLTLRERLMSYRALCKDGRIDAFASWFVKDGVMTGSLIGYDRSAQQEVGLYRMAVALLIAEANRLGVPLQLSGGAGRFKELRGAEPMEEFEAVYDRHLAGHRRMPWAMLATAGRLATRPGRQGKRVAERLQSDAAPLALRPSRIDARTWPGVTVDRPGVRVGDEGS
jgi:hypothetical protein